MVRIAGSFLWQLSGPSSFAEQSAASRQAYMWIWLGVEGERKGQGQGQG